MHRVLAIQPARPRRQLTRIMSNKSTKPNPKKTVMVKTVMTDTVYKIFTESEWKIFQDTGKFEGSADDLRDGFIHLSTKDQLARVIEMFFSNIHPLYIAKFSSSAFVQGLKWEISDSNEIYPHLYKYALLKVQVSDINILKK